MTDAADGVDFDGLFASIDAMDTERFLRFIHDDASFRFGSAAAVRGHADIRAAVEGFFASVAALQHEVLRIVGAEPVVVCEGKVTYTRHDGSRITLPFANVFELKGALISSYHVYIDIGPLYAQ